MFNNILPKYEVVNSVSFSTKKLPPPYFKAVLDRKRFIASIPVTDEQNLPNPEFKSDRFSITVMTI